MPWVDRGHFAAALDLTDSLSLSSSLFHSLLLSHTSPPSRYFRVLETMGPFFLSVSWEVRTFFLPRATRGLVTTVARRGTMDEAWAAEAPDGGERGSSVASCAHAYKLCCRFDGGYSRCLAFGVDRSRAR